MISCAAAPLVTGQDLKSDAWRPGFVDKTNASFQGGKTVHSQRTKKTPKNMHMHKHNIHIQTPRWSGIYRLLLNDQKQYTRK